tara:strand:- start:431 stop:2779 length:2349 start_codon:yes stop_codon:yes gene_type:complete
MKRELQLYIQDTRVDLFKDETVSLTDTIKNVKDIAKVFTTFTKSFTLPASSVNNKLFQHYYNFDIVGGFDARTKKTARIEINQVPFKEGKIKLEGVDLKNNKVHAYRVTFFGNTVDLKDIIGDDKLNNLDFVEVKASGTASSTTSNKLVDSSATFTSTVSEGDRVKNVTDTSFATVTSVDSNTQLTINQDIFASGETYQVLLSPIWENDSVKEKLQLQPSTAKNSLITPLITHTRRLIYDSSSNTHNSDTLVNLYHGSTEKGVEYTDLKFALRIHSIIEAIENTYTTAKNYPTNISFSNHFFNTTNLNYYNLYMWLHRKSGEVSTVLGELALNALVDNFSGGVSPQGPDQITGYSASGTTITFSQGDQNATSGGVTSFSILVDVATANTQVYTVTVIHNGVDVFTSTAASASSNVTINSSDLTVSDLNGSYQIRISANAQVVLDNVTFTATGFFKFEDLSGSTQTFNYSNTTASSGAFTTPSVPIFEIQNQMPEIKVIDFITALFKMFNLVAFVNSSGQIEVRTLDNSDSNSYYHSSNTTTHDITEYVNIESSTVDVALPYKEIKYAYEDLKSYLSIVHQQLFNQEWGTLDYNQDTTANFIDGKSYKIILPFSHFKYERLSNIANSAITSIQWGWSVNENQEAYKDKPLVFYPLRKSGDNISYLNPNNQDEGIANYNIPSNSRFTNDVSGQNNIHFNAENNEYDRPVTSFDGTLFKNYYENYITRIFDSKNRLTKIKAKLPLNILLNFELNDKFKINEQEYRINSITTDLTTGEADIELLNV